MGKAAKKHGGKRVGAGRKPSEAHELRARFIEDDDDTTAAYAALMAIVRNPGHPDHCRAVVWRLEARFGKPKQSVDITGDAPRPLSVVSPDGKPLSEPPHDPSGDRNQTTQPKRSPRNGQQSAGAPPKAS